MVAESFKSVIVSSILLLGVNELLSILDIFVSVSKVSVTDVLFVVDSVTNDCIFDLNKLISKF